MIEIRTLQPEDDLHDLIGLSREFFDEYQGFHEAFFDIDSLQDEDILAYFRRFVASPDAQALIALRDGKIIGYITAYLQPQRGFYQVKRIGHISGLMVHKVQRRNGIANQLFSKAVEFFTQYGIRYYTVFTSVNDQAAISLYEKNGMTPLHITLIGEL